MHSNHSTIIGNITFYRVTLEFLSQVFLDLPNQALMKYLVQANPFKDWPVNSDSPELRRGLDLLASFCEHWTSVRVTKSLPRPIHLLRRPRPSAIRVRHLSSSTLTTIRRL